MNTLNLPEEILLLALRDEDGLVEATWIHQTLAGALLAELILGQHIEVSEDDQQIVSIASSAQPRPKYGLLADALERIENHKRQSSLQDWVSDLAIRLPILDTVAETLCDKGILQLEKKKILFFFSQKRYPEVDPKPEREIRDRLKSAITADISAIDDRTRLLIALARSSHLIRVNLGRDFVRQYEDRIEAILAEDLSGQTTLKAVNQAQQALFVATTMPAITTTIIT